MDTLIVELLARQEAFPLSHCTLFCNIHTFRLNTFDMTFLAFPFRYDFNVTKRRLIERTILENFNVLTHIHTRYRNMRSTKNCARKVF